MKKIAIVGVSCSGKTTLGKKIAKKLNITAVDIDEINWKPGWVSTPKEKLVSDVIKALQVPSWVVSGNYNCVQDYIVDKADTIIWLNYSPWVVGWRALKRTLTRFLLKKPCCNGNYESIRLSFFSRDSILLWVIKTYKRRKNQYEALRVDPKMKGKSFLSIKSPKEARILINIASKYLNGCT